MFRALNKLDREMPLIFVGVAIVVAAVTTGLAAIAYEPPVGCPNVAEVIRYFPSEKPPETLPQPIVWPSVDDRFWSFESDEEPPPATLTPIAVEADDPPPRRHRRHRWWRRW